jgi:hypothetical protein
MTVNQPLRVQIRLQRREAASGDPLHPWREAAVAGCDVRAHAQLSALPNSLE